MDLGLRVLAALYLLMGIAGSLPGVFLLLAAVTGLAFWTLVLSQGSPPVTFPRFLEGVQTSALEAFPDFPLGLAGLGLLALHFLVAIPNLVGGLNLLRKPEFAVPWARRLAVLNLPVFPVGTALACLTLVVLRLPRRALERREGEGVGYLFGRLKSAAGALVDRGLESMDEARTLALHRARLAGGGTAPRDLRPAIEGSAGPAGFTQRRGGSPDVAYVVAFVIGIFMIVPLFSQFAYDISTKGAAKMNWLVAVPALVTFGGLGSLILFATGRRVLGGLAHGAELSIARWPLRPGEESRLRLRVKSRRGAKIERVAASLRLVESFRFTDKNSRTQWKNAVARVDPLPEATPLAMADGAAGVEWTLRVPRDTPTSFASAGAALSWQLEVDLRAASGPDGNLSFDLLVLPEGNRQ